MDQTARRQVGAAAATAAVLASFGLGAMAVTTSAAPPTCRGDVATFVGTDQA